MTSPGGREVGRVSVRVVPDTSGFRRKVKEELEGIQDLKIGIDPDTNGLRQKLQAAAAAAGRGVEAKIGVDVDKSALDRVKGTTQRALNGLNMPDFLGERSPLDNAMRRVMENAQRIRASLERTAIHFRLMTESALNLKSHFQGLQQRAASFRDSMRDLDFKDLVNGAKKFGTSITSGLSGVVGLVGPMAKMASIVALIGAGAGLLSVAGAGITVAWGAVATAIAAVPSAIGLLAAPIAAVMLGMDGIKKAAKTLEPAFTSLKSSVSGAFEKGLTPVFQSLEGLVRGTLTRGLTETASSLSFVSAGVADMLNAMDRADQIPNIFKQINGAIRDVKPGIVDIVNSTLRMMELEGGYKALTSAINTFGDEYSRSVTGLINDGSIVRAFSGLDVVLDSLSRAFVGLVENGIRAFAGAAPGTAKFIDSLTGFFGRFDWERMGKAAGNVFEGLGEIFDNVPDSTIEAFSQAFERLGQTFKDPAFQANIGKIIDALPTLVEALGPLAEVGAQVAGVMADVVKAIGPEGLAGIAVGGLLAAGLWKGMKAASAAWNLKDLFGKNKKGGLDAKDLLKGGKLFKLLDLFDKALWWSDLIGPAGGLLADLISDALGLNDVELDIDFADLTDKIQTAFQDGMNRAFESVFNDLTFPDKIGDDFGKKISDSLKKAFDGFTQSDIDIELNITGDLPDLEGGVLDVTLNVIGELPTFEAQTVDITLNVTTNGDFAGDFGTQIQSLVDTAKTGFDQILTDYGTFCGSLHDAVSTCLDGVNDIFTEKFSGFGDSATSGLQSVLTAYSEFCGQLHAAVTACLEGVAGLFRDGFSNAGTQATTSLNTLLAAVTAAMNNIVLAVQNGMTQMNAQFTLAQDGMALFAQQFTLLVTNVQLAMANLVLAVQNGMTLLNQQWTLAQTNMGLFAQQFALLVLNIQLAMQNMVLAVQLGMQQLTLALQNGLMLIQQAWLIGWQQMAQATLVAMQAIAVAVTTGMLQVQTALQTALNQMVISTQLSMQSLVMIVQTGMTSMVLAVQTGIQQMLAAVTAGFAQLPAAIAAGMAQAVASVVMGFAQMVASAAAGMASFVASVAAGFAAAASAAASGISSMIGAVAAWASSMISSAASAMAGFVSAITSGFGSAIGAVTGFVGRAVSALGQMASGFAQAGANAVRALASAIAAGASSVISAAANVARQAIAAAKSALGIASPSREFLYIGDMTVKGFTRSLEAGKSKVGLAAAALGSAAIAAAQDVMDAFRPVGAEFDSMIPSSVRIARTDNYRESIESPDYANIYDAISAALAQWGIQIDRDGIAKMVNNSNVRRARR